ncbi:MAG TPA: hypothetical protein VNU72_06400 [Puia sp.]|nr:hypothetical protein [Puia sp.]
MRDHLTRKSQADSPREAREVKNQPANRMLKTLAKMAGRTEGYKH